MSATLKMIEYAKAIASELNIDEPDFGSYNETSNFISENRDKYKKQVSTGRMIENLANSYGYYSKHFTEEFIEFLKYVYGRKGLYVFWDNDEIVYIGKSINLQDRIYSSLNERLSSRNITHISPLLTDNEADMHILEIVLITEYKPVLNMDCNCEDRSERIHSGIDLYKRERITIFEEG